MVQSVPCLVIVGVLCPKKLHLLPIVSGSASFDNVSGQTIHRAACAKQRSGSWQDAVDNRSGRSVFNTLQSPELLLSLSKARRWPFEGVVVIRVDLTAWHHVLVKASRALSQASRTRASDSGQVRPQPQAWTRTSTLSVSDASYGRGRDDGVLFKSSQFGPSAAFSAFKASRLPSLVILPWPTGYEGEF